MDDRYNKVDEEDKHQAIKKLKEFRSSVRQNLSEKNKSPQVINLAGFLGSYMAEVHGNRKQLTVNNINKLYVCRGTFGERYSRCGIAPPFYFHRSIRYFNTSK